jgi:hypothetical protein
MINALLAMEAFQGVRFNISRTDYSWQKEVEYTVHFRFDHGGDEISITRVGRDLERLFEEAHGIFQKRLGGAFSKQELYPTAIESKVVETTDVPF